jgi:hypothetical protein
MVIMWWVAMPGGRAESAQMLRTPMVVQTVPLRRGQYQVAVDFREGNPELCDDSRVFFSSLDALSCLNHVCNLNILTDSLMR